MIVGCKFTVPYTLLRGAIVGVLSIVLVHWDALAESVGDSLFVESAPGIYISATARPPYRFNLNTYLRPSYQDTTIRWKALFDSTRLSVEIQQRTHVVAISRIGNWIGAERVEFSATNPAGVVLGRQPVIVTIFVPPTITGLADITIAAGGKGTVLYLDRYLSTGLPDSVTWEVEGNDSVRVSIDTIGRTATLTAPAEWEGTERVTFLVRDRFGGVDKAEVDITAITPGEPPILAPFPTITLSPGEVDTSIVIDAYVFDPDTPDSAIDWDLSPKFHLVGVSIDTVTHTPLVRHLRISAPVGVVQEETDEIVLTARDPTFSDTSATLIVIVLPDTIPPAFTISLLTNPILQGTIAISVMSSESLVTSPEIEVNGTPLSITTLSQGVSGQIFSGIYDPRENSVVKIRVRGIDRNGNLGETEKMVTVVHPSSPATPNRYLLWQNVPNPVGHQGTGITYEAPRRGLVVIRIYNLKGVSVRTLSHRASTVGRFQIVWDGKDEKGHDVSNGIYLYRMEAGLYQQTRKLTVLR